MKTIQISKLKKGTIKKSHKKTRKMAAMIPLWNCTDTYEEFVALKRKNFSIISKNEVRLCMKVNDIM